MSEGAVVETRDLRKVYGPAQALCGLDLTVPSGSICGFLGCNGAGKTTAIKILLGMARPSAGEARVFGLAAAAPGTSVQIRQRIGFVSEEKDLYEGMTVERIIRFTASFYPRWRPDLEQRYARQFELPLASSVKALSLGTRTRLALLLALCRGAELLILDEPTSGLDPAMTEDVLQALVRHAGEEQMTVFFSSHHIAEIEQIADHVVIIHRGRTVVSGSLDDLRGRYRRVQLVFDGDAPSVTFRSPGVQRLDRRGRVLTILSSLGSESLLEEARALNPVSTEVTPVPLKDLFLDAVSPEN